MFMMFHAPSGHLRMLVTVFAVALAAGIGALLLTS